MCETGIKGEQNRKQIFAIRRIPRIMEQFRGLSFSRG